MNEMFPWRSIPFLSCLVTLSLNPCRGARDAPKSGSFYPCGSTGIQGQYGKQ